MDAYVIQGLDRDFHIVLVLCLHLQEVGMFLI